MANVLFTRTSDPNSKPVTDGQLIFDTSGNGKMYLDNGTDRLVMGGALTVDATLSKTSTNPVQNKAVAGVMLDTLSDIGNVTSKGFLTDALAVKELNTNVNKLNNSFGGCKFGVDTNGNRGYYDANGEFINFSNGDGSLIIGVADITTNMKNTGVGFNIYGKTAITLNKEYDLSKYKYLQLIYQDYNYYTRTWGIGYTKTPCDSYSNCMATPNKVTVSANGNSQNTRTTKTIYFDISNVNEKGYPFVYYTSEMYSHILKLQLVNELEEI